LVITGDPGRVSLAPNPVPPVPPREGNPAPPRFWAIKGGGTAIRKTMSQIQALAMVGNKEVFFMGTLVWYAAVADSSH
jgi:hypothetical protein